MVEAKKFKVSFIIEVAASTSAEARDIALDNLCGGDYAGLVINSDVEVEEIQELPKTQDEFVAKIHNILRGG